MDFVLVTTFVENVGFPIAIALVLMYQNKTQSDAYLRLYYELKETIEENSKVIATLVDEIGKERRK